MAIISFALVTKWWYALPDDAPDTIYWGFPLVYEGVGWATSLSLQIFIIEFIVDLFAYFLFWLLLIMLVNYYLIKIKPYRVLTISLWILSIIIMGLHTLMWSNSDNIFYLKRGYKMDVLTTGHQFIWENVQRPDYNKYRQEKKK